MSMNENQEAMAEDQQETVSFDFDDDNNVASPEDLSASSEKEENRTIVRDSENSADEDELENYSDNVQKRINQLTAKRKQAIEEAEAAYAYAQQVQQQNEEMKKKLSDLDKGYISEYGSRIESQGQAAQRMLQEAYDAGDMGKVAEAQKVIAKLAIEEERLRIQKARSESVVAEQPQPQQVQQPQRQPEYDQKLVNWMGKNPWFGNNGDIVMTRGAQAIHEQLVAGEGFDPTTDEYYAEIDKRMRQEFPHKFQGKRQNAQAVTPASSGRSATKSGRKKTVELTPGQVAFAKKMKIPLERYAQEVAKLERKEA
jgi:hypothetical protein